VQFSSGYNYLFYAQNLKKNKIQLVEASWLSAAISPVSTRMGDSWENQDEASRGRCSPCGLCGS